MSRSAGDKKKVLGPCSARALVGLLTHTTEACCEGALKPGVLAGPSPTHPLPPSTGPHCLAAVQRRSR